MSEFLSNKLLRTATGTELFSVSQLLAAYSERFSEWATHASTLAQMNRSSFLRDVFAFVATKGAFDATMLAERVYQQKTKNIDFRFDWLNRLGGLVAFQNFSSKDTEFALFCLAESAYKLQFRSLRKENVRLQVEILIESGEFAEARRVVSASGDLLDETAEHLRVDLANPFIQSDRLSVQDWLAAFNKPFLKAGISEIVLNDHDHLLPFDRLDAAPQMGPTPKFQAPLISVIMTSYAPDVTAFQTAVRSILNQSWSNFELIIVDDATPGGAPQILDEITASDSRVKVIRLNENRGTYHARNVGLRAAQGAYVTGQDSDDWSHPDRLFSQINCLLNDPAAVGVVTKALRSDDNFVQSLRGLEPQRLCEASLMFRVDDARHLNGYVEARKGADSEFRLRLETLYGRNVKLFDAPLYLTRLSKGSLSRGDFRRGWSHQNRRAFSNFLRRWHKTASSDELAISADKTEFPAIPIKFRSVRHNDRQFDYVVLSDWRFDNAGVRSALFEIEALKEAGHTVGIMQLSGLFPEIAHVSRLSGVVQDLINAGEIDLVIPDENAIINRLIVRNAELLQFAPVDGFIGSVDQLLIFADQAPSAWDGASPIYHPQNCAKLAQELFGSEPIWLTQDPAVHDYLRNFSGEIILWSEILPLVFPNPPSSAEQATASSRSKPRRIGRIAKNLEVLWPEDIRAANELWPESDENIEVRILGDARCYLRKFGQDDFSSRWVVFHHNDISLDAFFSSLDYFIYYPDENWPQSLSYEGLIAYSRGLTVILPARFRRMHRDRARFMNYSGVSEILRSEKDQTDGLRTDKIDFFRELKTASNASKTLFAAFLADVYDNLRQQQTRNESFA